MVLAYLRTWPQGPWEVQVRIGLGHVGYCKIAVVFRDEGLVPFWILRSIGGLGSLQDFSRLPLMRQGLACG